MNKTLSKQKNILAFLFLSNILLLLPLFYHEALFLPIIYFGIISFIYLIIKPNLSIKLALLTVFLGVIFSYKVGFTLKLTQLFLFIYFIGIIVYFFKNNSNKIFFYKDKLAFIIQENKKYFFLFGLLYLSILPSIIMPLPLNDIISSESTIKPLINFSILIIFCFTLVFYINSSERLKSSLLIVLSSFCLILVFGFIQQISYYLGSYNPIDHIGKHSTFVDFYGPFLRFSPGTFANEYGEICQSICISLNVFLILMKKQISFIKRVFINLVLFISLFSLILNFTRASWLVYSLLLLWFIFFINNNSLVKIKYFSYLSLFSGLLIFLNAKIDLLKITKILDRFTELSNLNSGSFGTRLEYWQKTYKLFEKSPFIGNGWGINVNAHNVPLELLSEVGIFGLITFYCLISYLIINFIFMAKRTNNLFLKTTSISIYLSLIGCVLFDLSNHGIYHFILWLIIGLGIATEKLINQENKLWKI